MMRKFKHTIAYKKTKRFLKQLSGEDVWFKPQSQRLQVRFGDWCIDPSCITDKSIVYSLGVGEDIDFDIGMIENFGVNIHAFDPTPNSIEWLNNKTLSDKFIFRPFGISGFDGTSKLYPRVNKQGKKSRSMFSVLQEGEVKQEAVKVTMRSLPSVMNELGHDKIDILKMDIEAAEYDVVRDIVNANINIRQILVEFHHRFKSIGKARTIEAVTVLNNYGYKIFFISDLGREYSFIKID